MADDAIRVRRLELVDEHDRVRAVLSCEEGSGVPSCVFFDAKGESRVIVGLAWNDLPQIQLAAADGTARAAIVVRPEGMGMIVLADETKRTRMITPAE